MVQSTNLPINADFESGFSDTTQGIIENVLMALDTGIAGISIEDSTEILKSHYVIFLMQLKEYEQLV